MEITLSSRLLLEASNKIAAFIERSDQPVLVRFSDDSGSLEVKGLSDPSLPANSNISKILSSLLLLVINHSSGDATEIKSDSDLIEFLKFVTQETDIPKEPTAPMEVVPLFNDENSSNEFEQGES